MGKEMNPMPTNINSIASAFVMSDSEHAHPQGASLTANDVPRRVLCPVDVRSDCATEVADTNMHRHAHATFVLSREIIS